MIKIYRYIFGYLKIRFYGDFPEKILNICAENGIVLWKSKSVEQSITAFLSIKDLLILPDFLKKTGIRFHIEGKYGLPFIISKYKKRSGLIVGLLLMLCFLYIMSGFIWIINIEGNHKVSDKEIINGLKNIGIYEGVYSGKIIPKNDSQRLLLEMDSLSWVSLNIEGSCLTVNVSETKKKTIDNINPCNLKAKFDGIIKKIDLKSGNCVVKVGDTVKSGDVLVSGIIENIGGTRFVHSSGSVTAQVTHNFTLNKKYKNEENKKIGKFNNRRVIEIFTIKIPLFLGAETKNYKDDLTIKNLKLFDVKLPIRIFTKEFSYTEKVNIVKTKEQLYNELEKEMEQLLKEKKYTDLTIDSKNFHENEEGISLTYTVTVLENIAYEDFLIISTRN